MSHYNFYYIASLLNCTANIVILQYSLRVLSLSLSLFLLIDPNNNNNRITLENLSYLINYTHVRAYN